jgi:AcrR family transcriptional regulator
VTDSGNDSTTTAPVGRRARNRAARHEQLMAAASEIVSTEGLDGLTMQAVADRVECAVGTIYTYFDSKSSLLTALQIAAIETLGTSFRRSRALWDDDLDEAGVDEATAALVRLVAFGHLFTSAPTLHPREFELLQVLLSTRRRETSDEDARKVLPYALGLINEFRLLIEAAVEVGALRGEEQDGTFDDHSLGRTVAWAGALNGALLVSNVAAVPADGEEEVPSTFMGDVFDGRTLALRVGRDLLAGWGAPLEQLAQAEAFVQQLRDADRIAVSGAPEVDEDGTVDLTGAAAAAES